MFSIFIPVIGACLFIEIPAADLSGWMLKDIENSSSFKLKLIVSKPTGLFSSETSKRLYVLTEPLNTGTAPLAIISLAPFAVKLNKAGGICENSGIASVETSA